MHQVWGKAETPGFGRCTRFGKESYTGFGERLMHQVLGKGWCTRFGEELYTGLGED